MSVLVALMSKQMYTTVSAASFPIPFDFPTPMWLMLKPMIYLCHLPIKVLSFLLFIGNKVSRRRCYLDDTDGK